MPSQCSGNPLFSCRPWLSALAVAAVVAGALPLLAGVVVLLAAAGFVLLGALYLLLQLLYVLAWVALVLGIVVLLASMFGDSQEGCLPGGLMTLGGGGVLALVEGNIGSVAAGMEQILGWGLTQARELLDWGLQNGLYFWPWVLPAGLLMAGAAAWVIVGLLRGRQLFKRRVTGLELRCWRCGSERILFACPKCQRPVEKLRPSRAGIFWIRCQCGAAMATLDLFGRLGLSRSCGDCGANLQDPWLGKARVRRILVLDPVEDGGQQFRARLARLTSIDDSDSRDEAWFADPAGKLDPRTRAVTAVLRKFGRRPMRFWFYLLNGEESSSRLAVELTALWPLTQGLLVVIDATVNANRQGSEIGAASRRVSLLIEGCERAWGVAPSKRLHLPTAVVVIRRTSSGDREQQDQPANTVDDLGRQWLLEAGLANCVNMLEARLTGIRYFTAIISGMDPSGATAAPMQWLIHRLGGPTMEQPQAAASGIK